MVGPCLIDFHPWTFCLTDEGHTGNWTEWLDVPTNPESTCSSGCALGRTCGRLYGLVMKTPFCRFLRHSMTRIWCSLQLGLLLPDYQVFVIKCFKQKGTRAAYGKACFDADILWALCKWLGWAHSVCCGLLWALVPCSIVAFNWATAGDNFLCME